MQNNNPDKFNLPSLDYDMKMSISMLYGGCACLTKLYFSFWTWIWLLGIQLQGTSPTFDKEGEME